MSEKEIKSALSDDELQGVSGGVSTSNPQVTCACKFCGKEFANAAELKAHEGVCPQNPNPNPFQEVQGPKL